VQQQCWRFCTFLHVHRQEGILHACSSSHNASAPAQQAKQEIGACSSSRNGSVPSPRSQAGGHPACIQQQLLCFPTSICSHMQERQVRAAAVIAVLHLLHVHRQEGTLLRLQLCAFKLPRQLSVLTVVQTSH
jgi:hypothetical protein